MTESGKTTLAKRLAQTYKAKGIGVIVLDPLFDNWACDKQINDGNEFLRVYWDSRNCMVFIDESADTVGRYEKAMIQTATRGRHWGHSNHYITQRATSVALTVRDQCSHLFLFASGFEDCKTHAREWNQPELLEAAKFEKGEYFHCTRFGKVSRNRLF